MILMLEGANGTGKTTLAQALSQRWSVPLYRVFKTQAPNTHAPDGLVVKTEADGTLAQLASLGVELNSHVEELFLIDFLSVFKPSAIMDRGMPSAIAYGREQVRLGIRQATDWEVAWDIWEERASGAGVVYVWLTAPHPVAKARCLEQGRQGAKKEVHDRLHKSFEWTFNRTKLQKVRIDTSTMTLESTLKRLLGVWKK